MKKVGIFYATKNGKTQIFANQIAEILKADIFNIKDTPLQTLEEYKTIILMSPSYFFGAIHEDWGSKITKLGDLDFSNKNIALVGVGGRIKHMDSFCSGVADFYDKLAFSGAKFVGSVPIKNYGEFSFSRMQRGNSFIGLCIDTSDDNENNTKRINEWAKVIQQYLNA